MEVRTALYRHFAGQGKDEQRRQNGCGGYAGTAADLLSIVIGDQGRDTIDAQ